MATTASFLLPCITPIRMMRGELVLSTASGFFLKQDEQWFLVSNWHNFAGRRSDNGQPLHKHGALPDICAYHCAHLSDDKLSWKSHQIDLGDATTNDATWFQHPDRGQEVDLAVIAIPAESVGKSKDLLAPDGNDVDMLVDLGGEVFVPGYPLGITGGGAFETGSIKH